MWCSCKSTASAAPLAAIELSRTCCCSNEKHRHLLYFELLLEYWLKLTLTLSWNKCAKNLLSPTKTRRGICLILATPLIVNCLTAPPRNILTYLLTMCKIWCRSAALSPSVSVSRRKIQQTISVITYKLYSVRANFVLIGGATRLRCYCASCSCGGRSSTPFHTPYCG